MTLKAVIRGVGHYLPSRIVENAEFEKTLNTSDDWIRTRTGIERRHFVDEGETTSQMATKAALAALKNAQMQANDIDAIIVATSTPDLTFPATATMVQNALGISHGFAFDMQAVCAGFVFAMANANALIVSGQAKRILVIGAETFSKLMDWDDRGTCILFGDGAGAIILECGDFQAMPANTASNDAQEYGVLASEIHSDGQYKDILYVDGGVSTGTIGHLRMAGKEVFRHAVDKLSTSTLSTLKQAGLTTSDVSLVVPHQANIRILQSLSKKLDIPMDRIMTTVHDHGNTSAASIPLALSAACQQNKLSAGDIILMTAIGGGLSWGSMVIRWA